MSRARNIFPTTSTATKADSPTYLIQMIGPTVKSANTKPEQIIYTRLISRTNPTDGETLGLWSFSPSAHTFCKQVEIRNHAPVGSPLGTRINSYDFSHVTRLPDESRLKLAQTSSSQVLLIQLSEDISCTMAEFTKRSLHRSRIPHLALSLLVKRATPPLRPRLEQEDAPRHISSSAQRWASPRQGLPRQRKFPPVRQQQPLSAILEELKEAPDDDSSSPPDRRRSLVPRLSFQAYFRVVMITGFVSALYFSYLYMSYTRAVKESAMLDLPQNADVSSRWMDMSRNFDDEVDLSEKLGRIRSKRRRLCQEANGNVLEVSVGTGRNMDLYNWDPIRTPRDKRIKSIVFNDQSEIMVYQAQKKFDQLQENSAPDEKFRGPVKFIVGDAGDRRVISRPEGGFDTIIQTMGVCSMANPVGFLRRLGDLCRQPGEKSTGVNLRPAVTEDSKTRHTDVGASEDEGQEDQGGKILLLEHGRSYHDFINQYLDNGAKMHAHRYGCWWNKDIEQVVRDSGLIIESKRRYHFGTTYEYILRPRRKEVK
ncbi:uncharacterized protein Z518_06715 [Rhinocladiella mackenziei CBS 650.93]|uniref:Uncharacterized protein n=1 Tax=Rhinocladiella mackenziei CBS 650.93 TaxID=1442369 RepID=A0A0D2IBG5_9EURO|nr:uncharacterized protein Z518_06715 [Rhinocladiella mackenziei CBS 650.93]KIX03164.1 hypothetical protein Z518_06715 [Rhinocladiella mackenziei CBS 650.93]